MSDMEKRKLQATKVFLAYWSIAKRVYPGLRNVPQPRFLLVNRLPGTRVGQATWNTGTNASLVEIKLEYLAQHPLETYNDVIPHEVAHVIAGLLYNSHGHDGPWRQVMGHFGIKASRFTYQDFSATTRIR